MPVFILLDAAVNTRQFLQDFLIPFGQWLISCYFHLCVTSIINNYFKTSLSFNQNISWVAYLQKSPFQKNAVCKAECKTDCNSPASTHSIVWILQYVIVLPVGRFLANLLIISQFRLQNLIHKVSECCQLT